MSRKLPHLMHSKYRPDIDGLRAVAILSVVGFHIFPEKIPGGFTGVDIFFVISGFLISTIIFSSLERDRFSLVEFYIRRIRRIFPALILVMIVCLAVGWFALIAYDFKPLGLHIAAGAGFVSNYVLWKESGYFDRAATAKPLLHLWSLAVEEQFYIFWPLLLSFVWKKKWRFISIVIGIAIFSFAINIYLTGSYQNASFYLPVARFWELMTGGVLAFIVLHRPDLNSRYKNGQSVLGIALVALGVVLLNKQSAFPGWWALLPSIGAFLIISAGPEACLNRTLFSFKPMVWIGLISYPLYLWHWPILSYLRITRGEPSLKLKIFVIGISILLAWLTSRFVEYPFRFGGRKKAKTAILLAVMVILGVMGYYTFRNNGFDERAVNLGMKIQPYDFDSGYRIGKCFLEGSSPSEKFSDICIGSEVNDKPTVFLWGDSHAASMYRGFLKQEELSGTFNLAQFTISGCPPVIGFHVDHRPQCEKLNSYIMSQIEAYRPDTVILAAYWAVFKDKDPEIKEKWNLLPDEEIIKTVERLKGLGIKHIYLIGHLPMYKTIQFKAGIRDFVSNGINRTYNQFNFDSVREDKRIAGLAKRLHVNFVSPIDTLCTKEGCLTSTSTEKYLPLAWDEAHLNENGAIYFIQSAIDNGTLTLP